MVSWFPACFLYRAATVKLTVEQFTRLLNSAMIHDKNMRDLLDKSRKFLLLQLVATLF